MQDELPINGRHRRWIFTCNNYTEADLDYFATIHVRFIIYGKEIAPTTGTPHLQGFVVLNSAKTVSATRKFLRRCRIDVARGSVASNITYCSKSGDCVQRGDPPSDPAEIGRAEIDRWNSAWDSAKRGELEEIPADIRIRSYTTLKRIHQDYMPPVEPLVSVCGLWIFGESGAGKTRAVLREFPTAFIKPRNNWWDGYQEEEVVLIDDIDKFDVALGGKLKHWGDFAPFIAEIKGGSRRIRPRLVIVTSQYVIGDIWKDRETQEALGRRFKLIEKLANVDVVLEL